jgi:hypothetical protein
MSTTHQRDRSTRRPDRVAGPVPERGPHVVPSASIVPPATGSCAEPPPANHSPSRARGSPDDPTPPIHHRARAGGHRGVPAHRLERDVPGARSTRCDSVAGRSGVTGRRCGPTRCVLQDQRRGQDRPLRRRPGDAVLDVGDGLPLACGEVAARPAAQHGGPAARTSSSARGQQLGPGRDQGAQGHSTRSNGAPDSARAFTSRSIRRSARKAAGSASTIDEPGTRSNRDRNLLISRKRP